MALPTSGSISLGQVLEELRAANPSRGYPISLGDADVRALAGVGSGSISLSNLYGKSAASPLSATGNNDYAYSAGNANGGTVTAYPSVTVSGGSGPRTFAWSVLSSNQTVGLGFTDQQQCSVSRSFPKSSQGFINAYLRCVVSDSSGSVTVDNIVATLEWENSNL